jgi:ParB family transcriptional regulator, chromosome partitioning protein
MPKTTSTPATKATAAVESVSQPAQPVQQEQPPRSGSIAGTGTGGSIVQIRLSSLAPHPFNVRTRLAEKGIEELANSMRNYGILQPLVIVPTLDPETLRLHADQMGYSDSRPNSPFSPSTSTSNGRERLPNLESEGVATFWVVAGNRRLAAARLAGLKIVPCVVRTDLPTLGEQQALMLVENTQRENLNPLELAKTYLALQKTGLTTADIARKVGKTYQHISDYLDLLKLPLPVLKEVASRRIAYTAALAANNPALSDTNRQLIFADLIGEALTIKQVKARVMAMLEAQEQQADRLKVAQARLSQSQLEQEQEQEQEQQPGDNSATRQGEDGSEAKELGTTGSGSATQPQTQLQLHKPDRRITASSGMSRVSHSAQASAARMLAAKQEAADPRFDILQELAAVIQEGGISSSSNDNGQSAATTDVGTGTGAVEGKVLHYAFSTTCADCGMYKEEPAICAKCPLLRCIRTVLTATRMTQLQKAS